MIELRFNVLLDKNTGPFGDVLPSQSLGVVLKKLNLTQQKQTTQEPNGLSETRKTHKTPNLNKRTENKPEPKPTLIVENCSCVSYVCIIVHNCRTQHSRTVLIIFPLTARQSSQLR